MDFQRRSPSSSPSSADGTLQDTNADGTTGIGSWEATGPNSFNLTFNSLSLTGSTDRVEGSFAMGTIRAAGEVSEDGQSFTAEYTLELTGEGAPPGEFGLGSVTGTRINVEPMGTPVAPVEALFPDLFPPEEGTTPGRHRTAPGTAPAGTEPAGHRTGRDHADRYRGGNHDGLDVAPGSTAGEPLDGTRLAPQCWTRREPQYPVCAWGGDAVPGAGRGQTAIVHASRQWPPPCRRGRHLSP